MFAATNTSLVWFKRSLSFWNYFNQPLFDSENPVVLNPAQFWRSHTIHLDYCLSVESVDVFLFEYQQRLIQLEEEIRHLEDCWVLSAAGCDLHDA